MSLFKRFVGVSSLWRSVIIMVCFSLYFIIEANNQNWSLIPVSSSIKIGLIVFGAMLFTFGILCFFTQFNRAILIVCWLALHYLYFKLIYVGIVSLGFLSVLRQYKFYLPLLFFTTMLVIVMVFRLNLERLKRLVSYVTVLFMVLVLYEFYKSAQNIISDSRNTVLQNNTSLLNPISIKGKADVFLIVMDEYTGYNQLKEYYNFKNDSFVNKLKANGFFVAQNPKANYNSTLFSTLSLLNMAYLDTSVMGDIKSARAYAKLAKEIEANLIFDFFHRNGYKPYRRVAPAQRVLPLSANRTRGPLARVRQGQRKTTTGSA